MKRNSSHQLAGLAALPLLLNFLVTGCGPDAAQEQHIAAQRQEVERLRAENQDLPQVRTENAEVQQLKRENQELPKVRSQYQEAARLRKENEQLRQQVTKLSPAGSAATNAAALAGAAGHTGHSDKEGEGTGANSDVAQAEGAINDGDDIMVDPKALKQLLPDFDWEKFNRKEPVAIRSILEKDGLQITNVAQLKEFGITNFTIQKAVPPAANPGQAPR